METENNIHVIFESLLPDPLIRKHCLNLLVDYITYADQLGKSLWVITLKNEAFVNISTSASRCVTFKNHQRIITLNVGNIPVYGIYCPGKYPDNIYRSGAIRLVYDSNILNPEEINQLTQQEIYTGVYKFTNGMRDTVIDPSKLMDVLPLIENLYKGSLEKAAENFRKRTPFYKHHSHDIINYLKTVVDRDVPEPAYSAC